MSSYIGFVTDAVRILLDRQSARWGGRPDGTLCITITNRSNRSYRSIGGKSGDTYLTYPCPEQAMEMEPYRLDLSAWPVLERLSEITGDAGCREMVRAMAHAFGRDGFNAKSGLAYLGQETQFDVIRLKPVGVAMYPMPKFKPAADLPLDILWRTAPDKTARMIKSAYYALVTNPDRMDYNRFCVDYDFDDSAERPATPFSSSHVAFAQTGSMLIHWWSMHFARTGDPQCLAWAQAMTDKWRAVQHPVSGLVPHWFGSDRADEPVMPPRPYANVGDTMTALEMLLAARELRGKPEADALASQLADMAVRLLRGIARHGYDPHARIFPNWLRVEGGVDETALWYAFRTEKHKAEMVKRDPVFREVPVFIGQGFYRCGAPWDLGMRNPVPCDIAKGACMTGDAELTKRAAEFAPPIMEEARALTGEFNAEGLWTYPASASYIEMMLSLFRATGDRLYLSHAQELAEIEIGFLSQALPAGRPQWWRMQFRDELLDALLELHAMREGRP
jgi:hypothetical protein